MHEIPEIINAGNVQGIVLWGYGRMPSATFSLCRIVEADAFRTWLKNLLETKRITSADHWNSPEGVALNLAFTARGLDKLLPTPPSLSRRGFSEEFVSGMRARADLLGDVGTSAPDHWMWHDGHDGGVGAGQAVDVILLGYWSRTVTEGDPELPPWTSVPGDPSLAAAGLVEIERVPTETMRTLTGHVKEHFGFADGIGNPRIRSWRRPGQGPPDEANEVEPGEFLLGYPDQDEASLFSSVFKRTRGHLGPPEELDRGDAPQAVDEFLRDGSYLVARQLEQDVPGFLRFAWHHADAHADPARRARHVVEIASKMMGRWPNGASLTIARSFSAMKAFTSATSTQLDSFSYAEDSAGLGCPFGAHVRRVHPRDTAFRHSPASPAERSSLVNRRRLLRRGRSYGTDPFADQTLAEFLLTGGSGGGPLSEEEFEEKMDQIGKDGRGLLFLCLSAGIARQFEHVQRTWINNPFFKELGGDPDPVTGPGPDTGFQAANVTIPTPLGRRRLAGLQRFVTVKAGAYFFLPSLRSLGRLAGVQSDALTHRDLL